VTPRPLQDLIGDEAARWFAEGPGLAIVPLGSTEFHGPRGPYGTDCDVAWEIGRRVAAATGALLLPPLPFGNSPDHIAYPGTIHLGPDTLEAVLTDILESLHRHGVTRVLLLLGHWGNHHAAWHVQERLATRRSEMQIEVVRAFDQSALDLSEMDAVFGGAHWHGHGGAVEVSVSLSARPQVTPPSPEEVAAHSPPPEHRSYAEIGWQGLPEKASAERGERAADITARAIVRYLKEKGVA
jgi:creatinine amidohydrolase